MKRTVKIGPGKLFIKEGDNWVHAGDMKERWIPGMSKAEYNRLRAACCFLQPCVEGLTCRHPENIPQGQSWGECEHLACPMNKFREE